MTFPFLPQKWWLNIGIRILTAIGSKYDKTTVSESAVNEAKAKLRNLRLNMQSLGTTAHEAVEKFFESEGFVWKSDPLNGLLDYVSDPAIAVSRKSGDCDDMAAIWSFLIPTQERYALLEKGLFGGHVITCGLYGNGVWDTFLVTSNMRSVGVVIQDTPLKAIAATLGKTFPNKTLGYVLKFNENGYVERVYKAKEVVG